MSFHPEPPNEEKRALRASMRTLLAAWPPTEAIEASARIAQSLISCLPPEYTGSILVFHPTFREPAILRPVVESFPNARMLLPRVAGERLTLHEFNRTTPLIPNRFRIPEPGPENPVPPSEIDIAVIPGLAFDARGVRLGHGGGYYDRLLADLPPTCVRTGVCFDFQRVERIPREPHDASVHRIITDRVALEAET